jgi:hypothetical protein
MDQQFTLGPVSEFGTLSVRNWNGSGRLKLADATRERIMKAFLELRPTTYAAPAPSYAARGVAIWNKFSFSSGTLRSKPQSDTSEPNRISSMRRTTPFC